MLIPSLSSKKSAHPSSLSRRVNANSQLGVLQRFFVSKLIKKGEC